MSERLFTSSKAIVICNHLVLRPNWIESRYGALVAQVVGVNGTGSRADVRGQLVITVKSQNSLIHRFYLGEAHGMKGCPMNLLSLSLLLDVGAIIHFEQGDCYLQPPGSSSKLDRVPLRRAGGLFQVPVSKCTPSSSSSSSSSAPRQGVPAHGFGFAGARRPEDLTNDDDSAAGQFHSFAANGVSFRACQILIYGTGACGISLSRSLREFGH